MGTDTVQENATGSMSQVALGYRDGPLSETHGHVGTLRGGDRVPDLAVRHRTSNGWDAARLQALLDPSRATLLIFVPNGATKPDDLNVAAGDNAVIEIAPDRKWDRGGAVVRPIRQCGAGPSRSLRRAGLRAFGRTRAHTHLARALGNTLRSSLSLVSFEQEACL